MGNSVIHYLGRYTHRIAISNRRIVSMTDETVTYLVRIIRMVVNISNKPLKEQSFCECF